MRCSHTTDRIGFSVVLSLLFSPLCIQATSAEQAGQRFDVATALQWVANHQQRNGTWSFSLQRVAKEAGCQCHADDLPVPPENQVPDADGDMRATALAVLAFLGAGHNHQQGAFVPQVGKGVRILTRFARDHQGRLFPKKDQRILADHAMVTQAYATQALVECYLRTQDPALRQPAQDATTFVCGAATPDGGWTVGQPAGQPRAVDGNVHATSCNVVALLLAVRAGLDVPPQTLPKAAAWLRTVEQLAPQAGYTEAAQQGLPNPRALPSGLFLRLSVGLDGIGTPGCPDRIWLQDQLAQLQTAAPGCWKRDPFYTYAMALALAADGQPAWIRENVEPHLLKHQWRAHHNMPHRNGLVKLSVTSEQDGQKAGSRLYWTVMAVLIAQSEERWKAMVGNGAGNGIPVAAPVN